MRVGKLPHSHLKNLLDSIPVTDPRVLLGPSLGEDAAFIQLGNQIVVATTDPITFATDRIGWYAVHVNANDVASCGARPQWFMATVLVPPSYTPTQVDSLFGQITTACSELKISLVGGHTEISRGLDHPIVVGCLLGEVEMGKEVRTSGALPSDVLLLTKGIAIEGTAILAREATKKLEKAGVSKTILEHAKGFLDKPGISVVKDALTAVGGQAKVHAMHDLTEGGLATALWELAAAAEVGLRIDVRCVPILDATAHICKALNLDPLGLLASGSMIIAVDPLDVPFLVQDLFQAGIPSAIIGNCLPFSEGVRMVGPKGVTSLPDFDRDELARFLETPETPKD